MIADLWGILMNLSYFFAVNRATGKIKFAFLPFLLVYTPIVFGVIFARTFEAVAITFFSTVFFAGIADLLIWSGLYRGYSFDFLPPVEPQTEIGYFDIKRHMRTCRW